MDIILTSLGTHNPTIREYIFEHTLNQGLNKMLFITTGCNLLGEPDFLIDEQQRLAQTEFDITQYDIADKSFEELCSVIATNDVIWMHGGKPFYLLKHIRETRFKDALLQEGKEKIYVGQSSGSYIACPNIDMALWKKPDRERFCLEDATAMGLVDFMIFAHHVPKYNELIKEKKRDLDIELFTITDEQAIAVINGKREFINY